MGKRSGSGKFEGRRETEAVVVAQSVSVWSWWSGWGVSTGGTGRVEDGGEW
jgi:hypothetical protein